MFAVVLFAGVMTFAHHESWFWKALSVFNILYWSRQFFKTNRAEMYPTEEQIQLVLANLRRYAAANTSKAEILMVQ
jgi:hypothetical protein